MLNVLDLFSGVGGFSLGLERTGGFQTVQFVEQDPACQRVLKKHWPDVPVHDDVTTFEPLLRYDVICGGFPCQDLSLAGKGAGLQGARSGLWFQYLRIIDDVRPSWVLIENVAALRQRGLDQVLSGLSALGYQDALAFIKEAHACMVQKYADMVVPMESSLALGLDFSCPTEVGTKFTDEQVQEAIDKLFVGRGQA